MKNILTVAMMALLFLFVGVGCGDEKCENAVTEPADATTQSEDQDLVGESDAGSTTDSVTAPDVVNDSDDASVESPEDTAVSSSDDDVVVPEGDVVTEPDEGAAD